ncbi:hypothetical protein FOZ62_008584, partial [Perkinsus olseni]
MANQNQFPHVIGSSSPFPPPPQGVPYPNQDEIYPPYAWAAAFPGGFALPPGPDYDDNPAWV